MKYKNLYIAKSQAGIATVLTVALVGIALIVSIAGTGYYLRTKQYSANSNHALTQAQADVWSGVEIVRQYLKPLDKDQLDKLKEAGIPLPDNIPITAKVDSVKSESELYTITCTITSRNTTSKSASTVQVIYEINLGMKDGEASITDDTTINAIDIYGDLEVGGGIEINGGKNAIINVHGNINTTGTTFTGVSELNVTGNVTLAGGGEVITKIVSNGNVTIGSSRVDSIYALGTVTLNGGGTVGAIYANKDVTIPNGNVTLIDTLGNITIDSGKNIPTAIAGGYINLTNGSIGTADAKNHINLTGGGKITTAVAGTYIKVDNGSIGTADAKNHINLTGGGKITTAVAGTYIKVDNGSLGIASALGNITFKGESATSLISGGIVEVNGGSVGNISTKGDLFFSGSSATSLISGGNVTINTGTIGTIKAIGTIMVNDGNSITNAVAKGNITLAENKAPEILNITTEKKFICNTEWWDKFTSINAKGIESSRTGEVWINGVKNTNFPLCPSPNKSSAVHISSTPIVTFSISDLIEPSTNTTPTGSTGSTKKVTTSTIKVDANEYLSQTNYIFNVDTVGNIIVSVKNIKGITDGTYYLGRKVSNQSKTYLCTNINNEVCTINPVGRIGEDQDWDYKPITYNSKTGWSLIDNKSLTPSIAPGILFFYGDVDIGQGTYINTFLATGNITVSTPKIYAPNYADVGLICNTSYGMPTNICTSSMVLAKANIGYIALLAGSYAGIKYVGGDITTTSNAYIYGNIIAGNKFNTNGATSVKGQIVAANLGSSSTVSSSFNSKVTVDLTNIDKTIDDSDDDSGGEKNDSSATRNPTIKWARYL